MIEHRRRRVLGLAAIVAASLQLPVRSLTSRATADEPPSEVSRAKPGAVEAPTRIVASQKPLADQGGPKPARAAGARLTRRRLEAVEMLKAILGGSQMGPGEGWFHDGELSRGWPWLARRCGAGLDDRIGIDTFVGPVELFDRLDRDRDGWIDRGDFDWSYQSPWVKLSSAAAGRFRAIDLNSNGRVSKAEWGKFFDRAGASKDHLTPDDFRDALIAPSKKPEGPPPDMPTTLTLITGLLKGEVGSVFEGPRVGELAPEFVLPTIDRKAAVDFHQIRGKRPVVLVFGSFT